MTQRVHRNRGTMRWAMVLAVGYVLIHAVRWAMDLPVVNVYEICGDCGLDSGEIDHLEGVMRESGKTQTRAQLLARWAVTIEVWGESGAMPAHESNPCGPCAEALLDAAGVE